MGREWLFWVGGGGGSASRRRRSMAGEAAADTPPAGGCMCAVFQLFDLHHFQLPLNHEEPTISPKGVEAPRNSLELQEQIHIKTVNSALKEEDNLNFPVGIQIKTSHGKISSPKFSRTQDFSPKCSTNSPGTKSPNLVARLMGLDILPESSSPSLTSTKSHFHQKRERRFRQNAFFDDDMSVGARSLPETPRVSSSSSRKSDFEYHHHRLSLQVNKDEKGLRFRQDSTRNSTSSSTYARQIVKQAKESVSKRIGLSDITNRSRDEIFTRRDENLILLKPAKKISRFDENCSPRHKQGSNSGSKSPKISCENSNNYQSQGISVNHQIKKDCISKKGVKKLPCQAGDKASMYLNGSGREFPSSSKKKKEQFIGTKATKGERKSKKTQLSSDIMSISGPTLLQVKKDPSPPPTKLPQKQVSDALSSKSSTQLSTYPSPHHKIFTAPPDNANGCATPTHGGAAVAYGPYIQKILHRTGIITSIKCHTPSHPIDPSVFYYLELFHPSAAVHGGADHRNSILSHRCNRKLIFQLVDELLAEILKPHLEFNPWASTISVDRDQCSLFDRLCEKIDDFPAANCGVLEDIDLLIDKDFGKVRLNRVFEEEWGSLVCEIEGEIMEDLVTETAAFCCGGRPYAGGIIDRD